MAGFMLKHVAGGKITGGLDKLTGGEAATGEAKTETGEDPEIIEARLEAEQRRQEKHRRMENEREKMRQDIRNKYGIKKREEEKDDECEGRIGAVKRKTPEELAKEGEIDDSLMGQLNGVLDKAKTAVSGVADTVKGLLPFGK